MNLLQKLLGALVVVAIFSNIYAFYRITHPKPRGNNEVVVMHLRRAMKSVEDLKMTADGFEISAMLSGFDYEDAEDAYIVDREFDIPYITEVINDKALDIGRHIGEALYEIQH